MHRLSRSGLFVASYRSFLCGALTLLALVGCDSGPPEQARRVAPVVRDVPSPLRGTIGAEATIGGDRPIVISGYGLVVGLNGTGGLTLPETLAETMEREMARMGIGLANTDGNSPIAGRTPAEVLRDRNVAVVIVQAAVPPGSPKGFEFDVFVRAVNATDLEGGKLWLTDLRPQVDDGRPQLFGEGQASRIAIAEGPIFINPFADPSNENLVVSRTTGRILGGGSMTEPMLLTISLDNESHARARAIVSAINSRFPMTAYDEREIAVGRSGTLIGLSVPFEWRRRPGEFVTLVRYLPISETFEPDRARRVISSMKSDPFLATELAWVAEAMGDRMKSFLRELYDYPEVRPRLAALRAGARLNDPVTEPHLIQMARTSTGPERSEAIELLGQVEGGPLIETCLRDLLNEEELLVRISAYEALSRRAERVQLAVLARERASDRNRIVNGLNLRELELEARATLVPGMMQGVSREPIAARFYLDIVDGGPPMIYVTQQGVPRIVLFGKNPKLRKPSFASAWDNRLLLNADAASLPARIYYRDFRSDNVTEAAAPDSIADLIRFMAHASTPENPTPGLGLSFSETVGALYEIHKSGATDASFATERDRLVAAITDARTQGIRAERPETIANQSEPLILDAPTSANAPPTTPPPAATPTRPTGPRIVPIPREPKPGEKPPTPAPTP